MNKEINITAPILVTGGTGYLALWIIKQLLDEGFSVRATVRNKSNKEKNKYLSRLGEESKGALELFEADLLVNGSFANAMNGCELVFHTASPFQMENIKDPQKELVDPALKGTKNVLDSVNKTSTIKRVVLTSSCASIYQDSKDAKDKKLDEKSWNTKSSLKDNPYMFSKMIAEKTAWEMSKKQNRWDLITMNPGFILGPSLSNRIDSFSINFILSMLNGKNKSGVPELSFPVVDVRDVANAQILGAFNTNSKGRHILFSGELPFFLEIAKILKTEYGAKYPLPSKNVPRFLLYMAAPFLKIKWSFLKNNLGIRPQLDNSYSKKDLGIKYRPIKESIIEHAQQLIKTGLIK